jgi:hypothetical protein
VLEGAIESWDVEGMNTKEQPIASLAAKIENLIQEHVEATRRAAADALERAFSGKERASICVRATTKTSTSRVSSGARKYGKRRTPAELGALADRLHQVVCDKPGERMSVLAPAVGVTSRELHHCVRQLKDVGRIRSAGQRSETRYFPMTERETAAA